VKTPDDDSQRVVQCLKSIAMKVFYSRTKIDSQERERMTEHATQTRTRTQFTAPTAYTPAERGVEKEVEVEEEEREETKEEECVGGGKEYERRSLDARVWSIRKGHREIRE
jgi:hypothetical protein